MFTAAFIGAAAVMAGVANAQVTATGTMGPTNPTAAVLGTPINQTSDARLLSLNAIDDFCLFGPGSTGQPIGNIEGEVVAWCVQPRNNARVIPDGTLTAVHFVKTPMYWQVQGMGDFTKIDIMSGDEGGELDPHGATGDGNPVGGNVTANATGSDVHYQEWMNYMSYNQFCLRICINQTNDVSAALQCQHTLDVMGCQFVMPGDYTDNSFTECDGDAAVPPGLYPLANGSTSTFAQRYTGTYTVDSTSVGTFTVGQTVTPASAYSIPATSNCKTYTSVGNGIASLAAGSFVTGASGASSTGSASSSMSASGSSASGSSMSASGSSSSRASGNAVSSASSRAASAGGAVASGASSAASNSGALVGYSGVNYGGVFAGAFSVVAVLAGAGALML